MKRRLAKAPAYSVVHPVATPASRAAALRAPAEQPTTRSKQSVSPACSSAWVIAEETTPRIPPPSTTRARRAPSARARAALRGGAGVEQVGHRVQGHGGPLPEGAGAVNAP